MKTKKPEQDQPQSEFDELMQQAENRMCPKKGKTARRRLKKTAFEMGSTPEEVMQKLLESSDNGQALNGSGSDVAKINGAHPAPTTAPSKPEPKSGAFKRLLIKLGLAS